MKQANKETARELILKLLQATKTKTMREIYERVEPGPDGRIRTSLSPVATITGRFGSSATFLEVSTNLQNIPKKTAKLDPLYDVRTVLVPDPGYILLEGDLSQAEARATSAFAGDARTLDLFASGGDIHRITAASIFRCRVEEVSAAQRQLGKMCRHALNYGMGWKRFLEAVNSDAELTGISISARDAKAIVEAYHRLNPCLVQWWHQVEDEVRRKGFLVNPFGRKLIFVDQSDTNSAIAFLPQSTIADHLNQRLVAIFNALDPKPFQVLLQVHDAVLGQTKPTGWLVTAKALKRLLESAVRINHADLLIPVDVSASSQSWGEMKRVAV